MSAVQLPLAAAPHRNQQLFSDYYLNTILPQRPDWKLLADDARPLLDQLRTIYAAFTPSPNEAQTEDGLIKPVLAALGHAFEVQAALQTPDGTKKPDYVFYRDQAALVANKGKTLSESLLVPGAIAVGDAKAWERPLDVAIKTSKDPFTNKNPSYQIDFYMRHSGLAWGILTNGRLWRLYHKDTSRQLNRFYEVDLPVLLERNDPEAFLYFSAFFHRSAFDTHPLGLDALLRASADYARSVSEGLKTQVYDALRHLAQGFLDYPANGLTPDAATLKQIYDHSLIVLYRLLFILYAEARELLPLRESAGYRDEYSLDAVKREVARRKLTGPALLPTTARLWAKLRDLFQIISAGSPPLKVATFNGGLFDGQRYPFLERHTVGDARLQEALDMLARVDGQFVDYRDLAERNLGTIYEGLLEYHLQPIKDEGGRMKDETGGAPASASSFIPHPSSFSIDLFNDRGERHRTGSYYTPEFIVQHIVEQALRPVLDAAVAGKASDAAKVAAVLAVNVADPAMGSGHFPVAATEYIARYLVDLGLAPEGGAGGEADVVYWKRRVAQSCIYGVDLNPLAVDLAKLSLWLATAAKDRPLSFLDHHLRCGNALVGSRVANLAATTGSATKRRAANPKSKIANPQSGQLSLLDDADFARSMSTAVDSMWLIEGLAGDTIAEVKEQERVYTELRAALTRRYARVADLVAATRFGLQIDPALWQPLVDFAAGRALAAPAKFSEWLSEAERLSAAQHFFHWELEFPEVFFDRHGQPLGDNAGFDAVIGNPPYVRQELLAPLKPFFGQAFADVYHGTADLFVYFFRQGVNLLRRGGRLAYIASNSWLRANYAGPLRAYLRQQVTLEQLIDLGDNRIFADAPDVYPAIPVVRNAAPPADHTALAATFGRGEGIKQFAQQLEGKLAPVSIHDQPDSGWQLGADEGRRLFAKLMAGRRSLEEFTNNGIYYGIKTGANEVFVVDQNTRDALIAKDVTSRSILKQMLAGEDLRPWYQESENRWLIFTRRGINLEDFPAIREYLLAFQAKLEPKPSNWDNKQQWIGRKAGSYKWFELQDSVDYFELFEKPKIFYPELAKQPRFSWDHTGAYVNNKGFIIPTNESWLLGLLNSRVTWFIIMRTCLGLGERAGMERFQLFAQYISRLPIPDAPASEREEIGALAMGITEAARARYALHRRARRRILSDLGAPGAKLNQKLTAWWELDFAAFRAEALKVFKRDIPLKQRDEWEEWLQSQRDAHNTHTDAIIAGETALNARVYALFGLSDSEIALIEASTKYRYGEV